MRAAVGFVLGIGFVVGFVVTGVACSDPRVAEDRAAACSNKIDDDGDGLIDCDDPDCAGTEACEKTLAQCSNSIDDDRNGTLDCRQDSCKVLPICKDAVESPCVLGPSPEGTCPRGKGCYLTPDGRRWCALEGPTLAGGRCGDGDQSDRSRGCASGLLCNDRQRCAPMCRNDYHCTRNSICRNDGSVGLCSSSCIRNADCDPGEECVAFQRTGLTLEKGGWAHECMKSGIPTAGSADVGMPCPDDITGRPTADVCKPGLLCVPSPSGARCREVCPANVDGTLSNCAGGKCVAVVPFSVQTGRFDEPYAIGVCIP